MHGLLNSAIPLVPIIMAAQMPANASAIVWVILGITALATAANQLLQMRERITNASKHTVSVDPDPGTTYRTRNDCNKIHPPIKARIEEVSRDGRSIKDSITTQLNTMQRELSKEIKALDDKAETRSQKVSHEVHARIDPLAERIAANRQSISQHLNDQRASANGGH